MPISDVVSFTFSPTAAKVAQAGFGVPMFVGYSNRFAERLRFYTSTVGMKADGFLATDAEYLWGAGLEQQSPKVERWAIGRGALPATLAWRVGVVAAVSSQKYGVKLNGLEASITSDSSATVDEIRDALKVVIDALGKAVTVAVPSSQSYITVTANAAGAFFSLQSLDVAQLTVLQNEADPGIATDLDAIRLYNDAWYGLSLAAHSRAVLLAAAGWVETNTKFMYEASQDTEVLTGGASSANVADTIKTTAYARSFIVYHPDNGAFAGGRLQGDRFPFPAGSEDWKFAQINGLAAYETTETHRTNMRATYASWFETMGEVNFMAGEGKGGSGEFAYIIRGLDAYKNGAQTGVLSVFLNNGGLKTPMTDAGGVPLKGALVANNDAFLRIGFLADDPAPAVFMPKVANLSSADVLAGNWSGIQITAKMARAVHKATITASLV